jgi:hypothetical protein
MLGSGQSQGHAHHFFDIKVHKEFVLARRTVNSAYYCDVLRRVRKNVRRLRLQNLTTKELAVESRQWPVSHFVFGRAVSRLPFGSLETEVSIAEKTMVTMEQ